MSNKIYILLFVLCCAGLGVSVFFAIQENRDSKNVLPEALQVDHNHINIGTIRQQETKDVTYRLRNSTENNLSLESVHTSCGCTEWKLDKRQLTGGETAELSVTFSSEQARNKVSSMIRVFYKNLETDEVGNLFLELVADVQPDYDISPPFLDFTNESESIQYVSLKPHFAEDIRVLDISCTRRYYGVEIVKNDSLESVVKIAFVKDKKLPGEKEAILELKTSSSRQPVYHVTLTCEP